MQTTHEFKPSSSTELAVFRVGKFVCGLDINAIHEINKNLLLTRIHQAPDYVAGIIALRGQILTIINLRKKFGLELLEPNDEMRIVVVNSEGEKIGLLVDRVDDIITADTEALQPPPQTLSAETGSYFLAVYQTDDELVAILDVEKILQMEPRH
jgi:purine-binding chemotaxis protein CheW